MPPADEQLWILAGLALVAAILALVVREVIKGRPDPIPRDGPLRLIVRPLKELRPDPNHLYLGTTIARELTAHLKKYERLDPAIGDSKGGVAIEGTVRKTGPRVVIAIRLMSARHPIWRGTYDGAINDLPQMEEEITANVARTLRVAPRKTQPPTPRSGFGQPPPIDV
jgi:TolB-like protein